MNQNSIKHWTKRNTNFLEKKKIAIHKNANCEKIHSPAYLYQQIEFHLGRRSRLRY